MKFRFVKNVPGRVKTYEGKTVSYGQEIEFSAYFSEKALRNPDFEAVQPVKKTSKKKVSKKKVTRRG